MLDFIYSGVIFKFQFFLVISILPIFLYLNICSSKLLRCLKAHEPVLYSSILGSSENSWVERGFIKPTDYLIILQLIKFLKCNDVNPNYFIFNKKIYLLANKVGVFLFVSFFIVLGMELFSFLLVLTTRLNEIHPA